MHEASGVFSLMHNPEIHLNVWCFYNVSHQSCAQPILEHPADIVILDAMLMRIVQDFFRNDFWCLDSSQMDGDTDSGYLH